VALARARRFDRERRTAALLTQALLPADVQPIDGYGAAARYLPAGSHVAGDWFDLTHLPSDRYLVGIGDAAGHGIRAASLMAQLRNAARGLAVGGNPPSEILHGLGLLAVEDDPESFATAIYGVLEPASGDLLWASAGHIPPLLCEPGKAAYLESDNGTPLGWPTIRKPEDRVTRLRPGDTVVLVTDGVLERRDADLGERLEQLRDLLGDSCELDARTVADRIVRDLCVEPEDDCCVVVLQRLPEAG
jgi:serine phosphatase RsbU (regulator of sigma subunit)